MYFWYTQNMEKLLILNKEIGETPLECIERFRGLNPRYVGIPMTYAGRLDPMAEGVLVVLIGEECKNKDKYLGLDKEYEVEVLFGFETDTYDLLGKVTAVADTREGKIQKSRIEEILKTFVGKFVQVYPMYSSKTVDGKPLFTYAKSGGTPDEMPTKEVEIYDIKMLEEREIDSETLLQEIKNNIAKVKGDFRQQEIVAKWESVCRRSDYLQICKIKVSCSSGTYMRTLAHNLGQKIGVPALAYSIKRTKINTVSN